MESNFTRTDPALEAEVIVGATELLRAVSDVIEAAYTRKQLIAAVLNESQIQTSLSDDHSACIDET